MSEKEAIQTAGTTSQDGTDAANAVSGTPDEAGRDAETASPEAELAALRAERQLWLQNKSKVEQANALEREVESLKRERDELVARPQPTYVAPDPRIAQQQQAMLDLQTEIQQAQWEASNGDKRSALLVSILNQQYQQSQYVMTQLQLQAIPIEDRPAVEKKLATGKFMDVDSAHEAMLGARYKSESESLKKRERDVEAQITAKKNGVVGMGAPIPVTAKQVAAAENKVMTPAEAVKEHARIMNEDGPEAARAFGAKLFRESTTAKL